MSYYGSVCRVLQLSHSPPILELARKLILHPRGKSAANPLSTKLNFQSKKHCSHYHFRGNSVATMPKDKQQSHGNRQKPVSCRFCRSRKLRCSRVSPCSNCVSRGIRCELEDAIGSLQGILREPELLERIRKLEKLVENQKLQPTEREKGFPVDFGTHPQETLGLDSSPQVEHLNNYVVWLESIYCGQDISVNIICVYK